MSDEHQVNRVDNFHSIPEEDGGNSQVYLPQPASRPQGFGDDQQWRSGSTPVVPSVSRLSAVFHDPVPSPGGNGVLSLAPPRLAYPGPLQELSGPPTPHSPVAEESWVVQRFPPVEESAGNGTGDDVPESQDVVTVTTSDVTEENNVVNESSGLQQESPQNGEEETFISVRKKKLLDENRQLHDEMNCTICTLEKRSVLLDPCGHVAVCGSCATELIIRNELCPVCRTPIETTVIIKLACYADVVNRQSTETALT